jgi:hypothetical protein
MDKDRRGQRKEGERESEREREREALHSTPNSERASNPLPLLAFPRKHSERLSTSSCAHDRAFPGWISHRIYIGNWESSGVYLRRRPLCKRYTGEADTRWERRRIPRAGGMHALHQDWARAHNSPLARRLRNFGGLFAPASSALSLSLSLAHRPCFPPPWRHLRVRCYRST